MRYYSLAKDKDFKRAELNDLDKAILRKCGSTGMILTRVLKAGKPYVTSTGSKEFASTQAIIASIKKLQKMGLLIRR